jgi:hypothetical protein
MITSLVVALVTVSIISFFVVGESDQEQVYAQTQGTNFSQLFSGEEFRAVDCSNPVLCPPTIKVLYQDPTLLVLTSSYVDVIWKGVALAQKEGYQIDAMTSYSVSGPSPGSGNTVNLLVAMSK